MSKSKTVTQVIKLIINAGQAKPGPPVGAALGQAGLKIMDFVKDFNAATAELKEDVPVPVLITAYSDRTFTYVMKTPPASHLIKKALGITKGSQRPAHSIIGKISLPHIYEIARIKAIDLPGLEAEAICNNIIGTCRSMGVEIESPQTTSEALLPPTV